MKWKQAMELIAELKARGCNPYKVMIGDLFFVKCHSCPEIKCQRLTGDCGGASVSA